jgi:hypothetical protein
MVNAMGDGLRCGHRPLPAPAELAALGAVLCVHPGELPIAPQARAAIVRAELQASVDMTGVREAIAFLDADGQCRGRLYLLPDTDFLAWEALAARLPQRALERPAPDATALCLRLRARLSCPRRQAVALRLRAIAHGGGWTVQAAATPLSALGLDLAHAIARAEDAEPMLAPPLQASLPSAGRAPVPRVLFPSH